MSIAFETRARRTLFNRPAPSIWTEPLHKTVQIVIVAAAYAFVAATLFIF